jgi:Tol biopolymer transport system component
MPPPHYRDQRPIHRAAGKVIYAVAGCFLLTVALIVGYSDLRGTATSDSAQASTESRASDDPIRFVVHAPERSTFGMAPAQPDPALSPDGKKVAFVAPFESNTAVWIQTVGNPDDARPIFGTNGADYPFWSPDGRYIAFFAGGWLKRVAATGDSPPRDIAAGDGPFWSGTWGADGTIVFGGHEGLYRVPREGGAAAPLTRIDRAREEFSHRFPVMLPNDTRFVYLVLSTRAEHGGLYLGSIDDPDTKVRLTAGDSNAAVGFDSNGRLHLIFVRDSVLVAQPFDASRGGLTGDAAVIASEKIGTAPTVRSAAFAASERTLIYRQHFVPSARLVWIDRRGIVSQQIGEEGGRWRFPSLSPDGTKLVALREDRSDTSGLWLLDLASGRRERLASGGWVNEPSGGALMAAWTRDGNEVVYASQAPDRWTLRRRAVTGADEVLFAEPTPHVKRIRDVTDEVALVHTDDGELWVIPFVEEGQPYRLPIEGEVSHARVSPNGRWLAYDSTEAGVTQVYVAAFPRPAERWLISADGGSDPQWRGDGRELYYVAPDRTLMAVSVETAATFDARTPEPLFRAPFDRTSLAFGAAYAPAPDGQRFLVAEVIGDAEPHLVAILNWTIQR